MKELSELVTILKSMSDTISERRQLVKNYVLMSEERERKQQEVERAATSLQDNFALNEEIQRLGYEMGEERKKINMKYN